MSEPDQGTFVTAHRISDVGTYAVVFNVLLSQSRVKLLGRFSVQLIATDGSC